MIGLHHLCFLQLGGFCCADLATRWPFVHVFVYYYKFAEIMYGF